MSQDEYLDVEIQIDQAFGFAVTKRTLKGSTIAELKDDLARDDPTGETRAEDLVLVCAAPGASSGVPLGNAMRIDETLLHLAILPGAGQAEAAAAELEGQDHPASSPSPALDHVRARTAAAELPSLAVAREVYKIINCAEEYGLNYEDYEDYAEALEQYWSDAIMDDEGLCDSNPVDIAVAGFDEVKYNETRLFKAQGDLLEAQQNELLCRQYLQMLAEIVERPWVAGEGVLKEPAEDDFEEVEFTEDGMPVRKAMKTGLVCNLTGGMGGTAAELERYVDVRKIWCLSEKAARIGQARRELIESVLTAHARDISAGGRGLLVESKTGPQRYASDICLEDIRAELDKAYDAKLKECTEELPALIEGVAKAEKVCEDRQKDLDRLRREKEEELAGQRGAADREAQARYDRELAEWREECRQADLRQEEERKQKEAAAAATRKAVHDAARRKCFLERYGQ